MYNPKKQDLQQLDEVCRYDRGDSPCRSVDYRKKKEKHDRTKV